MNLVFFETKRTIRIRGVSVRRGLTVHVFQYLVKE